MGSAIAKARTVFRERELQENAEIQVSIKGNVRVRVRVRVSPSVGANELMQWRAVPT